MIKAVCGSVTEREVTAMRFMSLKKRSARGASMVEYALILALVALVAILVLTALGINVQQAFNNLNANFNVAPGGGF